MKSRSEVGVGYAIQTCSNEHLSTPSTANDPIQAGCVPSSTLTNLPNLNSSPRNCLSGHQCVVQLHPLRCHATRLRVFLMIHQCSPTCRYAPISWGVTTNPRVRACIR